jgi:hypothetical protein
MVVQHVPKSTIPNDRAAIERDGFTVACPDSARRPV